MTDIATPTLKVASLNCEGHKHLEEKIIPWIKRYQPDVINFQEIYAVDIPYLQHAVGMNVVQFAPMANITQISKHADLAWGSWGICQLSKVPVTDFGYEYYFRTAEGPERLPIFMEDDNPNNMHRALAWMKVEKNGQPFTVATTHFTWSMHGEATPEQARDVASLLAVLKKLPEVMVSGDFNAPRGKATFATLAEAYQDNIPAHYQTSLDGQLHKAGQLQLMVDGFFTSPAYRCTRVELVAGVSDHYGIEAEVQRVEGLGGV